MGSEEQDPHPHSCLATAVLTESSIWSQELVFKSFWKIGMVSLYNVSEEKEKGGRYAWDNTDYLSD